MSSRLVLAGTPENLAEFRGLLPRSLQDKVVGQTSLDMNASPAEAWERAFEVAQAAAAPGGGRPAGTGDHRGAKGGAGALGLTDTLAALQRGRIHQLLVSPDLHAPGQQCTQCQAVVLDTPAACPYCGGQLVASADVVNLVVQAGHRRRPEGIGVGSQRTPGRGRRDRGGAAVLRRGT